MTTTVRSDASGTFGALQVNSADVLRFGADTSGQAIPFRNKLINCNFQINQLAVSGTVTLAAGQYGHDGFKAGASGCTYTFASSGGIVTLTIIAGTLVQVANGKYLQSGTYTLGWNGTAQARIDSGSYGVSPISGTAVGGTNQACEWGTGTLSLPQYEPGTIRTQFEFRDDEEARCRKYWKKLGGTSVNEILAQGYSSAGAALSLTLPFEPMNSNPVAFVRGTWGTTNCAQPSIAAVGLSCISLNSPVTVTGAATFTANSGATYIELTARL